MQQYYIHLSACNFAIVYLYKEIKFKTKPYVIELECNIFKYEPRHEISNNVVCATRKGSDQPAHTCNLIRAFASRLNIL